jgi:hypothetical protein
VDLTEVHEFAPYLPVFQRRSPCGHGSPGVPTAAHPQLGSPLPAPDGADPGYDRYGAGSGAARLRALCGRDWAHRDSGGMRSGAL